MSVRYTVEEANALLPELHRLLGVLRGQHGSGNGHRPSEPEEVFARLQELEIPLRSVEIGLIDFPGERQGRPVWLCWKVDETEVAWWHEVNEGAASRKPL